MAGRLVCVLGATVSVVMGAACGDPAPLPISTHDTRADAAGASGDANESADTLVVFDVNELEDDDIYGTVVPREASWWTRGGAIFHGPKEVLLRGINWFGLESEAHALGGLWEQRVDHYLRQLDRLGFTALRIPISPPVLDPTVGTARWAVHGDVDTALEQLDEVVRKAGVLELNVLLDMHTCDPGIGGGDAGAPDGCEGYDVSDWLADLERMAVFAQRHPNVLGIDLFNEPHALSWSAWRRLAGQGAFAVLSVHPGLLVFVQGTANVASTAPEFTFWGENLSHAAAAPPDIPRSRLVFSPHVYGPGVRHQDYFAAGDFPQNMPAIWDRHFGYLQDVGHTLVIGEFGGWYDDAYRAGEVAWNDAFVSYLRGRGLRHAFYWCLNPESRDTGGLLLDDWRTVNPRKQALLAPLLGR